MKRDMGRYLGRWSWGRARLKWMAIPRRRRRAFGRCCGNSSSKTRTRDAKKLHVNDSKLVYNTSAGLKELERSVLAVASACGEFPVDLEAFLSRVAPAVVGEMRRYPWYREEWQTQFPLEQEGMSVKLFANALRAEMNRVNTRCVHLAARVICEGELNRMFDATRNKSNVLFSVAAGHLDDLLRNFGDRDLVIICDRQGGRAALWADASADVRRVVAPDHQRNRRPQRI